MTNNALGRISDFIIKIIMIFISLLAIVFFAGYYPKHSLVFAFIGLIYVLAIITKGLTDIFSKD